MSLRNQGPVRQWSLRWDHSTCAASLVQASQRNSAPRIEVSHGSAAQWGLCPSCVAHPHPAFPPSSCRSCPSGRGPCRRAGRQGAEADQQRQHEPHDLADVLHHRSPSQCSTRDGVAGGPLVTGERSAWASWCPSAHTAAVALRDGKTPGRASTGRPPPSPPLLGRPVPLCPPSERPFGHAPARPWDNLGHGCGAFACATPPSAVTSLARHGPASLAQLPCQRISPAPWRAQSCYDEWREGT